MAKRKSVPEKKWIGLLGGSALFGYLGCLPPGSTVYPQTQGKGVDTISLAGPGDSLIAKTDPVVKKDSGFVRPDVVPKTDSVLVARTGPTLGEPCSRADSEFQPFCSFEGVRLICLSGTYVQGAAFPVSSAVCYPGDTLAHFPHFGFTGIDKAGRMETSAAISLRGRTA